MKAPPPTKLLDSISLVLLLSMERVLLLPGAKMRALTGMTEIENGEFRFCRHQGASVRR